jgi:hypothetical protein
MRKTGFILICVFFSFCKTNYAQKMSLFLDGTNYYINNEDLKNKQIKYDRNKGEVSIYFEIKNFHDTTLIETISIKLNDNLFRDETENVQFDFNQKICKLFFKYHDKRNLLHNFNTDFIDSKKIIGQFKRIYLNEKTISFVFFVRLDNIVFEGSFENMLINSTK